MDQLPTELWIMIGRYLDQPSLQALSLTCRRGWQTGQVINEGIIKEMRLVLLDAGRGRTTASFLLSAYWHLNGGVQGGTNGICLTDVGWSKGSNQIVVEINRCGSEFERWLIADNKYHRADGPAYRAWWSGVLTARHWCRDGLHHRIDGPAREEWSGAGLKKFEIWERDGQPYPGS